MASQYSNMRRSSKGRARWREDAVNHESAAAPSHYSKRVTPHPPREGRPVSWRCGMPFSRSSSTKLAQIDKRPTIDFAAKTVSHSKIHLESLGTFPRLFARLTHSSRLIEKRHERKNCQSRRTFGAQQAVARWREKTGCNEWLL